MNRIFLDVYFGQQLAESASNHSVFELFNQTGIVYIVAFIVLIYFIFILVFFVFPIFHKNPKSYFKRYTEIRDEMAKIDDLYSRKKLSFEEYSFAQFNYAKEYESIILFLSKYPEYKLQLQSYKIKEVESREKEYDVNHFEKKKLQTADFLFDLLRGHIKYYSRLELEQSILDEGFTKDIAVLVLNKLDKSGINYASEERLEQNKVINMLNSLLSKNYNNAPAVGEASTIDLSDLSKKKTNRFEDNNVTFDKYPVKPKKEKASAFSSFKNLFKSKPKVHTVSEINDVFADIERRLKEEKK